MSPFIVKVQPMTADSPGDSDVGLRTAVRCLVRAPLVLRSAYVAIFAVSVLFRVLLGVSARHVLICDASDYHVLAANLMAGHGYIQVCRGDNPLVSERDNKAFDGFTLRAYRSPGYPLLLAGLYSVFGWHPAVYLGINLVADVMTQVCAMLIAAYLFGAQPALVVQGLLAFHVLWTPNPMTESLYTALFTLLALLIVIRTPLTSRAGALGFGLLAAAALLVRPITLCVFPVLVWRHLWPKPTWRCLPLLGLALLPPIVTSAGWAMRNHAVLGQHVLFTTNFGYHNAPEYGIRPDAALIYYRKQGLNEAEIDRELTRLEWGLAKADPAGWGKLWMRRVCDLFSLSPPWEVEAVLWDVVFPAAPDASWISSAYRASFDQYYVTYPLFAGSAIVMILRRRRLEGLWLLMLSYAVLHAAVSRGDMRLVAPLYPLLCALPAGLVSDRSREGAPVGARRSDQLCNADPGSNGGL